MWVARNIVTGFAAPVRWLTEVCPSGWNQTCRAADVDGDLKADLVIFDRNSGDVIVYRHYGTPPRRELGWHAGFCNPGEICTTGYFNKDELLDVIAFVHGTDTSRPGQAQIATSIASFDK